MKKRINVKEPGKKLFPDSGTMTPVLKIWKKGFIVRYRSENDERILEVKITESGEKLKENAASVPENISKCIRIDTDKAVRLYQTLYKILRLIKGE